MVKAKTVAKNASRIPADSRASVVTEARLPAGVAANLILG
jgi:hypothetical protein